jgi:transposase-like protein
VKDKQQARPVAPRVESAPALVAEAAPEASPEPPDGVTRARPGRRSVEERQRAVLEVLSGKATVDQVARRLGVLPETVEGWRQDALGGIEESLRRGSGKTPRELELEREVDKLKRVVTTTAIEKCLLEQALDIERKKRPTPPARSRR